MTYDAIERSAQDGRPVELYEFRRGVTTWRFTSADQDVAYALSTYKRAIIERSNIERGTELRRAGLRLSVQRDLAIAQLYIVAPPADAITLTIRQFHQGDGDAAVIWNGRIVAVSPWRDGRAEIALEPSATSLRRTGLRRLYQRQCPHVLYGAACKASAPAARFLGAAGLISGLTVDVSGTSAGGDGYYAGGILEWSGAAGTERRFIVGHAGNTLTLSTQPNGLTTGTSVSVYPGCDHSLATCHAKFNNAANFGGFPFIPTKNPYGGDPVY